MLILPICRTQIYVYIQFERKERKYTRCYPIYEDDDDDDFNQNNLFKLTQTRRNSVFSAQN